jgi:hypothetical protein
MSHRGKAKGNAFELLIVKSIRKSVSRKYADDVVYRTPGSGGHWKIGGADIILEAKLRKIFNVDIECKHQKTVKVNSLFETTKQLKDFMGQTMENCFENGGNPMLVFRGNRTPIFAATTLDALKELGFDDLTKYSTPGLYLKFRGKAWKILLWKFVLKALKNKV